MVQELIEASSVFLVLSIWYKSKRNSGPAVISVWWVEFTPDVCIGHTSAMKLLH